MLMNNAPDTGQYVMMVGRRYLHLDPATWTWHLTSQLESLQIWDYHHDLDCLTKPTLEGKQVRYVELSEEELAIVEGKDAPVMEKAA